MRDKKQVRGSLEDALSLLYEGSLFYALENILCFKVDIL